jgi:hypothetical protein
MVSPILEECDPPLENVAIRGVDPQGEQVIFT